jgi:4-carboxymuconolactone decarboxylase
MGAVATMRDPTKERSMSESTRERGTRLMKDVCGISPPPTSRFVQLTIDHLFAEVWSNPELSIRDRRLVVLGVLGAIGDKDNLGLHMRQALERGDLSPRELEEVAVQIAHYAGWPRGTAATQAASQAIASQAAAKGEPVR